MFVNKKLLRPTEKQQVVQRKWRLNVSWVTVTTDDFLVNAAAGTGQRSLGVMGAGLVALLGILVNI